MYKSGIQQVLVPAFRNCPLAFGTEGAESRVDKKEQGDGSSRGAAHSGGDGGSLREDQGEACRRADFAEMAKEHSQCPSGEQGGELGEFGPGEMVPEFDSVVFSGEIGKVHGPIQTQFGYHLIEITDRSP